MIGTVLIYDCETTGVDPEKDQVIEVAGLLWSVHHESTISGFSFVLQAEENPAVAINGIPSALLREHGTPPVDAWKRVDAWMGRADLVIAHNAGFDRAFQERATTMRRNWVCTQDDIEWPRPSPSQKLTDIMLAHGLGVSHAHRALVDVMSIARLFERCAELGFRPEHMLNKALRPKTRYRAHVAFATNNLAKEAGFRWSPEEKIWWRRLVPEDIPALKLRFEISPAPEQGRLG